MTEQPKPCPFCGAADVCQRNAGPYYFVQCADCNGASGFRENTVDALAAWNRRAMPWVAVAERLPEPEQVCLWWDAKQPRDLPYVTTLAYLQSGDLMSLTDFTHWLPLSPDFFPAVDKLAQGEQGRDNLNNRANKK